MIELGSLWQHKNNREIYQVVMIAPLKLGGVWLQEPVITYRSSNDQTFHRLEKGFLESFTLSSPATPTLTLVVS